MSGGDKVSGSLISISVVSHLQAALVRELLSDLSAKVAPGSIEVIMTRNLPEPMTFSPDDFPFSVKLVDNAEPRGFGANHNAAFQHAEGDWFCVINPDIRIDANPFPNLLSCLQNANVGLVGPRVLAPSGIPEDSARRFPTPMNLLAKLLGLSDGRHIVPDNVSSIPVEWVAGMFMLFSRQAYTDLAGFDEGYFLYYEDVDICARAWRAGMKILICPSVSVVHDARRDSHRSMPHLRWHLASMARYFRKHFGRLPLV